MDTLRRMQRMRKMENRYKHPQMYTESNINIRFNSRKVNEGIPMTKFHLRQPIHSGQRFQNHQIIMLNLWEHMLRLHIKETGHSDRGQRFPHFRVCHLRNKFLIIIT